MKIGLQARSAVSSDEEDEEDGNARVPNFPVGKLHYEKQEEATPTSLMV